jgi:hypothetical protein
VKGKRCKVLANIEDPEWNYIKLRVKQKGKSLIEKRYEPFAFYLSPFTLINLKFAA